MARRWLCGGRECERVHLHRYGPGHPHGERHGIRRLARCFAGVDRHCRESFAPLKRMALHAPRGRRPRRNPSRLVDATEAEAATASAATAVGIPARKAMDLPDPKWCVPEVPRRRGHNPFLSAVYFWAKTFAMNSPVVVVYVPSKRAFAEFSHPKFFDCVMKVASPCAWTEVGLTCLPVPLPLIRSMSPSTVWSMPSDSNSYVPSDLKIASTVSMWSASYCPLIFPCRLYEIRTPSGVNSRRVTDVVFSASSP